MNNPSKTPSHAQTTTVKGKFYIPAGVRSSRKFIVPDDVVEAVVRRYNLAVPSKLGCDPMCGVGTVPRVILSMGGNCEASELDPHQYAVTKAVLPENATVTLTDCTDEKFVSPRKGKYDYIYTSLPFAWFKEYPKSIDDAAATAFGQMLKPGGLLIIDCDDITTRDGVSHPLAEYEKDYFQKNGFRFTESTRYVVAAGVSSASTDLSFTELAFVKI